MCCFQSMAAPRLTQPEDLTCAGALGAVVPA
jgi:hypothetical protein